MTKAIGAENASLLARRDAGPQDGPVLGWARALASGLAILLVAIVATVYGADTAVKKLTGVSRNTRQYLASGLFVVAVAVLAWVLRRLQARRLI